MTSTLVEAPPQPPALERPRSRPIRPRGFGTPDLVLLAASALSAYCLVWVVFYELASLSGAFGFLLCWYAVFLTLYWFVTARVLDRRVASDRVATVVMVSGAAVVVGLVAFIVVYVAYKAVPSIHLGSLLTKDQRDTSLTSKDALARIGVAHAIIGTLEQVGVAALIGIPFAVTTAVFLNEVGGRGTRLVRSVVTAMSGIPSIVAGVFVYSVFILHHILGYSGFAASLALFIIILPSVTRTTEEVLRIVPSGLREAALALGAPEWRTVWSVVLPTARSGIVTASLLGTARIVGETAPLLFTAFGSNLINANVFSQPQASLPRVVYDSVRSGHTVLIDFAYQAAFVLLVLVLVIFVTARVVGRRQGGGRRRLARSPSALVAAAAPDGTTPQGGST